MWTGRVTSGGRALFSEWASGKIITITRAAAGPQRYDQSALYECTDLLQKTQDLKITTVTKDRGGVEVNLRFTAADQTYFAAQIGIWAKLDDGDETMIAIYQTDTSGIEIPSKDRLTDFVYTFHALISVSVDAEYRVVVDATTLATKSDVNEVKYEIRPILYGGTGASSAAGALKNLGAVSKTGDKMTGSLSTTMLTIESTSNMTPNITFNNKQMKESFAKAVYDAYKGQFYIRYDVDGNGYYETYNFPIFTGNRKAIGNFDILTSKKAVSIAQGGTGATSAAAARSALGITPANIGAAKADHTHTVAADGITGILSIEKGGTGANNAADARTALGITPANIGAATASHTHALTANSITGTLSIEKGGTGATNAAAARTALGITPGNIGAATASHTHALTANSITGTLSIEKGGTGANNAADARTALGITPGNIGAATASHTHALTTNSITGTLSIEKGGTGANNAAAARTALGITPGNIGAVNIKGDTMTGTLQLPYLMVLRATKDWPAIALGNKDTGRVYGTMYVNPETGRLSFNMTAEGSPCTEDYVLPTPDIVEKSTEGWYQILTSKIAVTISQGGTGAKTAAEARSNLGVYSKAEVDAAIAAAISKL